MLSYVHAFHAGNSGDILKHIIFTLTIENLLKKDKPFSIIDTHSASGIYSFDDERIIKTQEAETGILKLLSSPKILELKNLAKTYLEIEETYSKKNKYAGSPEIAKCLLRENDELILNELHPKVFEELKLNCNSNPLTQKKEIPKIVIHKTDAFKMLNAIIPPKTKRGCVIIDPSYEDKDDYIKTAQAFCKAYDKWQTGTFLIWYPLIRHRSDEIDDMKNKIYTHVQSKNTTTDEKCIFFELKIKDPSQLTGLSNMYASAMAVINPPYTLKESMDKIIPLVEKILQQII